MTAFNQEIRQEPIIKALDNISLTLSAISSPIEAFGESSNSFHIYWSGGTATSGTITVELSQDNITYTAPITVTTINTTSGSVIVGVGSALVRYSRVRWNRTAGTGGTLTCNISSKKFSQNFTTNRSQFVVFDNLPITSTQTSIIIDNNLFSLFTGIMSWSGATVTGTFGTLTAQVSVENPFANPSASFSTTNTTSMVAGAATATLFAGGTAAGFPWIRFTWTPNGNATAGNFTFIITQFKRLTL